MRRAQLLDLVKDGRFFGVTFIRRTDGELRRMLCRVGVVSHTKGGEKPYNDEDYGLVTVWDAQKQAYRCFAVDNVLELRVNGMVVSFPKRLAEYQQSVRERIPVDGHPQRAEVEVARIPSQDRSIGGSVPRRREGTTAND